MTAFKRSQAKYVKHSCETTNWPEYEAGQFVILQNFFNNWSGCA